MNDKLQLVLGVIAGAACIPVLWALFRAMTIAVEDEEAVLVTSFGKLTQKFTKPGLQFLPGKLFPWTTIRTVPLKLRFREYKNIYVNDARGTTVLVDLWLEFQVVDAEKATFQIADWDAALRNLVMHSASSILGNRDFREILCDRQELAGLLTRDIATETERWGIKVELAFIQNVSLLPEVSHQIFESIAARLNRAKADIEEYGRIRVAKLEADTLARVASLVAETKGQYPAAVGRAFQRLQSTPAVYAAYQELYELSLVRPHRTIAFRGFAGSELRAADAAMLAPPIVDGTPHLVPGLSGTDAKRLG